MTKNQSLKPKKLTFIMLKTGRSPVKHQKITLLDYLHAKFSKNQVVVAKWPN